MCMRIVRRNRIPDSVGNLPTNLTGDFRLGVPGSPAPGDGRFQAILARNSDQFPKMDDF